MSLGRAANHYWAGKRSPAHSTHLWLYQTCLLLSIGLAALDLWVPTVNISISYSLPIILFVLIAQKPVPKSLVGLVIGMTLLAYLVKPLAVNLPRGFERIWHYGIVNRLMVVAVLVLTALLSRRNQMLVDAWRRTLRGSPATDPDDEFFEAMDRLFIGMVAFLLLAAIFVVDAVAPVRYNLAILYALPLLLGIWTCHVRLLWWLTVPATVLPLLGYWVDISLHPVEASPLVLVNRILTAGTAGGIAIVLRYWIHVIQRCPDRTPTTPHLGS